MKTEIGADISMTSGTLSLRAGAWALLAALAASSASAQDSPASAPAATVEATDEVAVDSAHERLIAALQTDAIMQSLTASVVKAMVRTITTTSPVMAKAAADHPGFTADLEQRVTPLLRDWSNESLRLVRPKQTALLARTLTPAEADMLATFYAAPLGQRMLVSMGQSMDYAQSINKDTVLDPLSQDALTRDMNAAARKIDQTVELTPEEKVRVMKVVAQPAFGKLRNVGPQMTALVIEVENRPPPPEFQAAFGQIYLDILQQYGALPK